MREACLTELVPAIHAYPSKSSQLRITGSAIVCSYTALDAFQLYKAIIGSNPMRCDGNALSGQKV